MNAEISAAPKIYLKTDRLIIREPKQADFENWHRLMSDTKTMYYLNDIMTHSENESHQNLNDAIADSSNPNRGKYFFAIEAAENSSFIGTIGYTVMSSTLLEKLFMQDISSCPNIIIMDTPPKP